jgi:hypothetical protein
VLPDIIHWQKIVFSIFPVGITEKEGKKKVGCFKNGMPTHSGEEKFRLTVELSAMSHN